MRLVGKFDSPYVRRVAVSLHLMGIGFDHDDLSVFRDYQAFEAVNAIVKAPTLVMDDGTVLLDSTLIIEVLERGVSPERRLSPSETGPFARHQRILGLALAACEKTVQIVYEHQLRPAEKRHAPWLERVGTQLAAAYGLLEAGAGRAEPWLFGARMLQADVTAAVAWRFTQDLLPGRVSPAAHPRLDRLSRDAEASPAFQAAAPA